VKTKRLFGTPSPPPSPSRGEGKNNWGTAQRATPSYEVKGEAHAELFPSGKISKKG